VGAQKLSKASQNLSEFLAGLRFEEREKLDVIPILL
jgi:hypothetical protein